MTDAYDAFLRAKIAAAPQAGFEVDAADLHPWLKPHAAAVVRWMLRGGRRAPFASFGLAKTSMQIEACVQALLQARLEGLDGARGLIVAPLGVRREFLRDAGCLEVERRLGAPLRFVRTSAEAAEPGLYLTNYESVREGKLDALIASGDVVVVSLDEAAVLRGFGGTETFRSFMRLFPGVRFRFCASATPSPNDYIELLAYAAFLGVMDIGQAKTRWFRRDSEKADALTLHPHKADEFWLWVASWGLFFDRPSDLGFSDDGYVLPPLTVRWVEVPVDHGVGGADGEGQTLKSGQGLLFRNASAGVVDASRERRSTLLARIAKVAELVAARPGKHAILWHDLEAEREALEAAVPGSASVYGAQDLERREQIVGAFADGFLPYLNAKPVMLGAGTNLQRHCAWAIYCGVSSKFHDFIQSVHRLQRFGQPEAVEIDVIYAESERDTVENLKRKWRQHEEQRETMREIVKRYGLSNLEFGQVLVRSLFDPAERIEVVDGGLDVAEGGRFRLVRSDCVIETKRMDDASVDLIVTSIPFSTQYEYSPSFNDFGHTDDNAHFFEQMGFLVPELLRVLKPGRVACIHVKDRIVPGGMTGLGFQTVYPFADDCRTAFRAAGFAYLGEKTNLTDVVRENNQTYRLAYAEQLKDGSRQGAGLPEKVLLFRRPPTDRSNGYADDPVGKPRPLYADREGNVVPYDRKREMAGAIKPVAGTGYSLARWQVDAHHLMRSSGDRHLAPAEWAGFEADRVYKLWKALCLETIYDFEHHVRIGEDLSAVGKLPPTFMLLPPHSWHADVWTDVMQARSLNTMQAAANAEKHLCPLPFDIVERLITQFSQPDEVVLDPFGGLMTTPYCALKLGRRGVGIELNPDYFLDGVKHVEALARQLATPTLFDALGATGPLAEVAA